MIKKIKIYTVLFLTIAVFSCNKDTDIEPLFDKNIDARIDKKVESYKATLVNSEFGWKVIYQPGDDTGSFNIYIKFNKDNTTEIVSDYDGGKNDLHTTYRAGITHQPELIFENYSVFHALFEARGFSLGAEFEFLFEDVSLDKIKLKSKTDYGEKSEITLLKATATDKETIKGLQGSDVRIKDGHLTNLSFRSMVVTNTTTNNIVFSSTFSFDFFTRVTTIGYLEEENSFKTEKHPISVSKEGFNFITPITVEDTDIKSFIYDETNNRFVAVTGELTAVISGANKPGAINDDFLDIGNKFNTFLYRPSLGADPRTSSSFRYLLAQINRNTLDVWSKIRGRIYELKLFIKPGGGVGDSYLEIRIDGIISSQFLVYILKPKIANRKLYFEYIPYTETPPRDVRLKNGASLEPEMQPILDFLTNPEGLIYTNHGTFKRYSNKAGSFINASEPIYGVYGVWLK